MGEGVERRVESASSQMDGAAAMHVRMLGPLTIGRNGAALELPASRKVRALFAYVGLAPHPVGRSRLC